MYAYERDAIPNEVTLRDDDDSIKIVVSGSPIYLNSGNAALTEEIALYTAALAMSRMDAADREDFLGKVQATSEYLRGMRQAHLESTARANEEYAKGHVVQRELRRRWKDAMKALGVRVR